MRIAVAIAASALLAGCAHVVDGNPQQSAATAGATLTGAPPPAAPAAGTSIDAVIAWTQAGTPADPGGYHSASRDAAITDLGNDVAFTTPSGTGADLNCMTDARSGGALACLADLTDPPPRPAQVYGEWISGWVDFTGPTLDIGSAHADPGRFWAGSGAVLPPGATLAFGDYRCRADTTGLVCVNYAHRSGARIASAGVEPFGCLQPAAQPADVGARYSC